MINNLQYNINTLQDYQVLNMLGRGGFACVYKARVLTTGQEVAIKMVRYSLSLYDKVMFRWIHFMHIFYIWIK